MSEKPDVEELLRRLDEMLIILRGVLGDLQEIVTLLRSMGLPSTKPTVPSPPKPVTVPAPAPTPGMRGIPEVKRMFPSELEGLLNFNEKENYIIIKPRQYLGSDNFAKIASIIRGAGGEYISAGKDSHFRIPKEIR
ncbi:MAG: hypothetical protein ACQXXH_07130 [Candidatus Bathyarchaeia archaeon]|jgi:hypothetical protein|nr:hypothetical protein [Candidatus Bathyarchaeota archaeon A05DMB-4]MDH7595728.1 hypothetical protein [Candidatus Bathyarchaeota archaeon]